MSLITNNNKRNLTEKQQSFLNNLIETKGDLKLAAELAGYAGNHYQVIKSLKEEIVDLAGSILAKEAPKAAFDSLPRQYKKSMDDRTKEALYNQNFEKILTGFEKHKENYYFEGPENPFGGKSIETLKPEVENW